MRGLYPIVDLSALAARAIEPVAFAEAVLRARPPLLQLRAKHAAPRDVLALLRALLPLCKRAGTRLFANDRPDLALLSNADGVHVGQSDLPLEDVRRLPGSLQVGVSTHDFAQLEAALAARPDYVAFGPVFSTASKERAEPVVGLERLTAAAKLALRANVPLVAIGGITRERAQAIASTGAVGAVIADLFPSEGGLEAVAARALELSHALSV